MTAADQPELIDAAAAAVEAGMQQAREYREAAMAKAGYGMEVRLPSVPGPAGPVVGLSYDTAPEPAPMPGNPKIKLVPDYASDVVGGAIHPAGSPAARTQWPAGTTVTVLPGARSSLEYVPASTASESWTKRLAAAIRVLLGR
jgi:hypothetical protein